jgi:putative ABC transport system permease protein
MRLSTLIVRSLAHYWRVNAAVVSGVAVAVAVLAGALVVGDSVRASLRGLVLERLGRADHLVTAPDFFRDELAEEIGRDEEFARAGFAGAVPVVALEGVVTHEASGRRAGRVQVYGVDERFWRFHGVSVETPGAGEALLSPALAAEFGSGEGDGLLLRVEKPSDIPVESLLGRKDDVGSTIRLRSRGELGARSLGEFSLRAGQGSVRSIFVPLDELRERLGRGGRANAVIFSAAEGADAQKAEARTEALRSILKRRLTAEDMGLKTRVLEERRVVAFETTSGIFNDETAAAALDAARRIGAGAAPVLSYLANSIRANGRDVPYSVVTAVDEKTFGLIKGAAAREGARGEDEREFHGGSQHPAGEVGSRNPAGEVGDESLPPLILNEWAARELGARAGDRVALDYYYWEEGGRLDSRSAEFSLVAVVPIAGAAADRDLVPDYPGISGAGSVAEWDPPFPVDLSRIRPQDEDYWAITARRRRLS